MRGSIACTLGLILAGGVALRAVAQPAPVEMLSAEVSIDSGPVAAPAGDRGVAFATIVRVPGAAWIKLTFDEVVLGEPPAAARPTVLRMTSLLDGSVQHHTAVTLAQWSDTSAVFNGDAVRLEIVADPAARPSRVVISEVLYGVESGVPASQCGPTDDRMPSDDPRVARTFTGGCTAWLISDAQNCMLTAGHCYSVTALNEVHFNVPMSTSGGGIVFPPAEDQYSVDQTSVQFVNGGIGNDWCYFGTFPNTETGLTAAEAQGAAFDLVEIPPPVQGQTIRITGHGVDGSPPEYNQVQQTHIGPYVDFTGSRLQYRVDTEGGNSGSPVINDDTGEAIGIHTHAGCTQSGGANQGTGSNNSGLRSALLNPEGICIPEPSIDFSFPNGLPDRIESAGATIRVEVVGAHGGEAEPGTGVLYYDAGGGFVSVPMDQVTPDLYDAVFPDLDCGLSVDFYFSAETTTGETVFNPLFAPASAYKTETINVLAVYFEDDFEADTGWTVTSDGGVSGGVWERGVPVPQEVCDRGNPDADADGSGQCYLTENDEVDCNSDVDGGATTLTSPVMDATQGTPHIAYARWYDNTGAGGDIGVPFEDVFVVEVSDDGGSSWVELETVGPAGDEVVGGWFLKSFPVADFVAVTEQFRIRFIAEDAGGGSVIEAAVDGVQLVDLGCEAPCPWDCADGDGTVGILDFLALLAEWGQAGTPCDFGEPGIGILDFLELLANWGPCP